MNNARFFPGLAWFLAGYRALLTPGLRRWVILPVLINTLLFAALLALASAWFAHFTDQLLPPVWDWLRWLLWPLFAIVAAIFVFYTFTLVANFIGAPFNSKLAYELARLRGHTPPINEFSQGLWPAMRAALFGELNKLFYYLRWLIPLLILSFVPVLNLLAPLLWPLFGAWMLVIEYADYPLGNQGLDPAAQRRWLAQRRAQALGFGACTLGAMLIPIVNLAVMPAAVAGATLFWLDEEGHTTAPTQQRDTATNKPERG